MRTLRHIVVPLLFVGVFALSNGCASVGAYCSDRGQDLLDIVTITVGKGAGVGVRVGPVHAGLLAELEYMGVRGGQIQSFWKDDGFGGLGSLWDPLICFPGPDGVSWGSDIFSGQSMCDERGKQFLAKGVCPFVMLPRSYRDENYPFHYFSQCDVAVGLGLSLRVGVNPGECLDFLLGLIGIDIYDDDVSKKRALAIKKPDVVESHVDGLSL